MSVCRWMFVCLCFVWMFGCFPGDDSLSKEIITPENQKQLYQQAMSGEGLSKEEIALLKSYLARHEGILGGDTLPDGHTIKELIVAEKAHQNPNKNDAEGWSDEDEDLLAAYLDKQSTQKSVPTYAAGTTSEVGQGEGQGQLVSESELTKIQQQLERLQNRVTDLENHIVKMQKQSGTAKRSKVNTRRGQGKLRIPGNSPMIVRLDHALSSADVTSGSTFTGTLAKSLKVGSTTVLPSGTRVKGLVTMAQKGRKLRKRGKLSLSITQIQTAGNKIPVTTGTLELKTDAKGLLDKASKGAAIGAMIDKKKGAVIGSAGALLIVQGKQVTLEAGQKLQFNLSEALELSPTS